MTQHTFVTVGTDLNKNWVVYQSRGSDVLVYDQFPLQLDSGRLSAAAAATVKATLTKAAANMRKIGGWLASPPTGGYGGALYGTLHAGHDGPPAMNKPCAARSCIV